MQLGLDELAIANPNHIWLEISEAEIQEAWRQSRKYSNDAARWHVYLNFLCLHRIIKWLESEEGKSPKIEPSLEDLPSIWDVVNGTSITSDKTRIVIIPSEEIDIAQMQVPQEWVDIPGWAAEYYLAVQVNSNRGWLRLWGFTTHQKLIAQADYDEFERCYFLDKQNLIESFNVMRSWMDLGTCERPIVAPLPSLSLDEAEELLPVLGKRSLYSPRLEVPFEKWGALMANPHLRRLLFEKRSPLPERPVFNWFQTGIPEIAQRIGWELKNGQPNFALAKGVKGEEELEIPAKSYLSRELFIAGQNYELRVTPQSLESGEIAWRFELRNLAPDMLIPGGLKLRLLTETGEDFEGNEVVAKFPVESLYNDIVLEEGEGIIWETQPYPEDHRRELLRF